MKKRVLGKTGEEVSLLGFGAMRLPLSDSQNPESIDETLAGAMLREAFDAGVDYVDTGFTYHGANAIQPGQSEVFVGRVLADGYRGRVKVATKLPTWMVGSKEDMRLVLDAQLRRLGVERIDFYLAHNLNLGTWPKMRDAGLLDFLDEERRRGRIGHVGFSFHDHFNLFRELLGVYDWSFVQVQYNYLDTEFQAGRPGVELAAAKGLGVIVMEPLRGGLLTHNLPEEYAAYLAKIRPEWSLAEWALRWVAEQPEVGLVLSGMSTIGQVRENITIINNAGPLSEIEREALAQVRARLLARIKVNCTGCNYCLPCPNGVNIPTILNMYNNYHLVDSDVNRGIASYSYLNYVADKEKAGNCTACGVCEPRCPQGIAIASVMPDLVKTFGK